MSDILVLADCDLDSGLADGNLDIECLFDLDCIVPFDLVWVVLAEAIVH